MPQKIKIIIILVAALLVMPLVYKALAFGGPNRGQFEVQSKGSQILRECPTGIASVVPDAAYSTHWLNPDDVIKATNGPPVYVFKYITEMGSPIQYPKLVSDIGPENMNTKEKLRAHVASVYLGKKQFAYYLSKADPEYYEKGLSFSNVPLEHPNESEGDDFDKFSEQGLPISKEALFSLGESFAYDLGENYQMGLNCDKTFESIEPPEVAGLFINYFDEQEVQLIMNHYVRATENEKDNECDMEELKAFMIVMMGKLANYIKLATPHTRPYTQ